MAEKSKMPGAVGSQNRALSHSVSGLSPAPHSHYTSFPERVKPEQGQLGELAVDWAMRSWRDAERAAAEGNNLAADDLLGVAMQALHVADQYLGAKT